MIPLRRLTKKDLILSLHAAGRSTAEIALAIETSEWYVKTVIETSYAAFEASFRTVLPAAVSLLDERNAA